MKQIVIKVVDNTHQQYAAEICNMILEAAKSRGTGISKREPEYIREKINEGKAVIALDGSRVVGFCYIESWEGAKFVANSGLIVHPDYRKTGLAKIIKTKIFELSQSKFPESRIFGITTSLAVMKINSGLGYQPVTFSELTTDEKFWKGCETCTNYDILQRTGRKMCLCTAMVYNPKNNHTVINGKKRSSQSWEHFKTFLHKRKINFPEMTQLYPKLNKILHK